MNRQELGALIKTYRKKRRLSKMQLALRLGYKTNSTINHIELGRTPIPVEKIHQLSRILDIPLDGLMSEIKEAEPELFTKFNSLKKEFFTEFKSSVERIGVALHHRPFRHSSEALQGLSYFPTTSDNVYYVNFFLSPNFPTPGNSS